MHFQKFFNTLSTTLTFPSPYLRRISSIQKSCIFTWNAPGNFFIAFTYKNNLFFTTNLKEALDDSNIIFIAVGTPEAEGGSVNLDFVFSRYFLRYA